MAATNKTENLNLNSWIGTDKPMREDFVNDNEKIDTAVHNHTSNTDVHLNAQQKDKIDEPCIVDIFGGDGKASKSITLPFNPKLIIFFKQRDAMYKYDSENNYTICNMGIAARITTDTYNTQGISMENNVVTVTQSTQATNGVFINLNELYSQYAYVAFK